MMFSTYGIKKLLEDSDAKFQKLQGAYALLPDTRCRRRTNCCAMLPEITLVEALAAVSQLKEASPAVRMKLFTNIINYFFINPVEITACPFLEGQDCLIYEHRFFGCRAYGLWSPEHYETLALRSSQAKKHLQKQWQNLGISLPQSVIDFQVSYCRFVEISPSAFIDDTMLLNVSDSIESISEGFSRWHHLFAQRYFSDLSFLMASLVFGYTEVVRIKLDVVGDMISTGNRKRLDRLIASLPDIFADPA